MAGDGPTARLTPVIREALNHLDRNRPLASVKTLQDLLNDETAHHRIVMHPLIGFAILAIVLAATGVYGVLSYTVAERRHEIAIRSSLGATPTTIRLNVLLEGLALAALGALLGAGLALGLSRFMSAILFEVSPADPKTFLTATLLIGATSVAASYLPAHRAADTHITDSLRVG